MRGRERGMHSFAAHWCGISDPKHFPILGFARGVAQWRIAYARVVGLVIKLAAQKADFVAKTLSRRK